MPEPRQESDRGDRSRTQSATNAIVADGQIPEQGQMRKSDFLDAVESSVRAAVDAELASVGMSSDSCPYLAAAVARYRSDTAESVERTSRRYSGSADGGPAELVTAIAARASRAAQQWARSGTVSGLESELDLPPASPPGEGVMAYGGLRGSQPDATWVLGKLGDGVPLPAERRDPMERAYGVSFHDVRLHEDAGAQHLARGLGRAGFTVGRHVVIDQPPAGPLGRSVVLAHELAHVVQQRDGAQGDRGSADLEAEADRSVVRAADVLRGDLRPGAARNGLTTGRGLQLQGCRDCGSGSTARVVPSRFSDVAIAVRAAPDDATKEAALVPGITASRSRADELRSSAGSSSGPIAAIRRRVASETGVGRGGSTFEHLDENPLHGVSSDRVEQAYRAWAENPTASTQPWVLLAIWVKEGLTAPAVPNTISASSAADARAIWRSLYYFQNMGTDHYVEYTATGGDNAIRWASGSGAAHDTAFRAAVGAQVTSGRLPRNVSGEIDAELTVTAAGPGRYTVTPSDRFFSLSLMLTDAYWRENREAIQANAAVPPGTSAADVDALTYMRWNMGSGRMAGFLGRSMAGNTDPDGSTPALPTWAFHREVVSTEWGQPRANAIRFQYASEAYRMIYEGW